jgi:hypothetical protein
VGFPAFPALVVRFDLGLLPGPALSAQVGHMKSSPELPEGACGAAGRMLRASTTSLKVTISYA